MKKLGLEFDRILTSPLTRCRQTARIVARELKPGRGPVVLRALAPGGLPREVLAGLPKQAGDADLLLVGHEPELSRLVSHLLLPMPGDMTLEFRKGGLCRIDFEGAARPGAGRLALFLSPRVLRLMG